MLQKILCLVGLHKGKKVGGCQASLYYRNRFTGSMRYVKGVALKYKCSECGHVYGKGIAPNGETCRIDIRVLNEYLP